MKRTPVSQVAVFYRPRADQKQRVGRLGISRKGVAFEYDPAFLKSGLELSPFKLPLQPNLIWGDSTLFDGLMGVFDDSLSDGWGRLLIDRRAEELGMVPSSLTPLHYLTLVGARSMGALVYEPEVKIDHPGAIQLAELAASVEAVLADGEKVDLDRLIALGGSPKGARPKVLVQLDREGSVRFGAADLTAGSTAWLVKFSSQSDDVQAGALEHGYFLMAKAAGVDVPRTQLLEGKYFAIERFDRPEPGRRVHMHCLGGLLHLPLFYPALDYRTILEVTRRLTRDEKAVAEMFRRACFNVLAHNRDDHARNFSFLMSESGEWSLSPAYDLTFSKGPGGEHTALVMGEGRSPGRETLMALAKESEVPRAKEIFEQVAKAVRNFESFADAAKVPARLRRAVSATLKLTADTKK